MIVIIALVVGLLFMSGIMPYLSLDYLATKKDVLKYMVNRHYTTTVCCYMIAYIAVIACGVPAVAPLTMLAGFLFGIVYGSVYSSIGATCGSLLSFFVVRYLTHNIVQKRYTSLVHEFHEKIEANGIAHYLLGLQFLTVVPFFVINTLAALADVPIITFFWTTVLGSCPIIVVYAYAGQKFSTISSVKDIFSSSVILLFAFLFCLTLAPYCIRKIRSTRGRI